MNLTNIVTSYKLEEITKLSAERKLIDLIPGTKDALGRIVVEKWVAYFTKLKVPFVVTREKSGLTLWKENKVMEYEI